MKFSLTRPATVLVVREDVIDITRSPLDVEGGVDHHDIGGDAAGRADAESIR